jgi:hypothetical protein
VADVNVTNNSRLDAHTRILAGTTLDSGDDDVQTIVLIRDCDFTVGPRATGGSPTTGCCANLHRSAPAAGTVLRIAPQQNPDLIAAAYAANTLGVDDATAQATVWLITDGRWPGDPDAVRAVLVEAGIDPSKYGYSP